MIRQEYSELSEFQERVIAALRKTRNVLVTAPSSTGKTYVARTYLLEYFQRNFGRFLNTPRKIKVAMIFPYKSIAVQEFTEISTLTADHGINVLLAVGGIKITENDLEKANFIIGTYEKFAGLFFRSQALQEHLKILVIDEFHFLGTERGVNIEELIMFEKRANKNIQLILLSSSIENPQLIAEWLQAELIIENQRPIPLDYECIAVSNIPKFIIERAQNGKQVIAFASSRIKVEKMAEKIAQERHKKQINNVLDAFLKQLVETTTDQEIQEVIRQSYFPPKLRKVLKYGVGYHHAGLSDIVRMLIEQLYMQGMLDILVATSTLSTGVNLPADEALYIIDSRNPQRYKDANHIFQTLGRAGRLGYKTHGKGIVVTTTELIKKRAEKQLFVNLEGQYVPQFQPVISFFGRYEQLMQYFLKLIVFSPEPITLSIADLWQYFADSYWYFTYFEPIAGSFNFAPLFSSLIDISTPEEVLDFYEDFERIQQEGNQEDMIIKDTKLSASSQIQAIVQEGASLYQVYISPSTRWCSCQNQRSNYLCRHQRFVFNRFPQLQQYLNRYGLIDFLIQEGFVVLSKDKRLVPTRIGQITARHYINPLLILKLLEFAAKSTILSLEGYFTQLFIVDEYFKGIKTSNELSHIQALQLILDILANKDTVAICERYNVSDSLIEELIEVIYNRLRLLSVLLKLQGKLKLSTQLDKLLKNKDIFKQFAE